MESLIVIIIFVCIGAGMYVYSSNRRAAEEARKLAEEAARRRQKEQEDIQRKRIEREKARLREIERQAALRNSIKVEIRVAVRSAIEATTIGANTAAHENNVVHIVSSAFEATGVAESTEASIQTRSGKIAYARQVAMNDAIARSNENATAAARKAANLEPSERTRIIMDARISAIKAAMVTAVKDALANLRGNVDYRTISNVRKHADDLDVINRIDKIAHEIDVERTQEIRDVRSTESERIDAIINAIEPADEDYARIASSLAASGRATAIKGIRKSTCNDTADRIVVKSIEAISQDSNAQARAYEGAITARLMAATTMKVIDTIEDTIEDAVASTCMRTGYIEDTVEASIANAIEISIQDVIFKTIDELNASTLNANEYIEPDELDNFVDQLNVPIENFEGLPKLESPAGYVYVLKDTSHSGQYKIGRTSHPKTRINNFSVELPIQTEILAILKTNDAASLERRLHDKFALYRTHGEWFELNEIHIDAIRNM